MKIIEASATIISETPDALSYLERCARTCYNSFDRIAPGSATRLLVQCRDSGHLGVFDCAHAGVEFVVDRAIANEIVRHRVGVGYCQESTRYVNYGKKDGGLAFVAPRFADAFSAGTWERAMGAAEGNYLELLKRGEKPELARSVLPLSTATRLAVAGSFTYWRNFFRKRTNPKAHPQMRVVAVPLLAEFVQRWAPVFGDLATVNA